MVKDKWKRMLIQTITFIIRLLCLTRITPERPASPEYRKENEVKTPLYSPKEIVREEIKYVEVPAKKITEIRIFFDNGTYETFKPEN